MATPDLPSDRGARLALAQSPEAPCDVLRALLVEFPEEVLANPVLPLYILEGLWRWEGIDPWTWVKALDSPQCPPGLARWSADQLPLQAQRNVPDYMRAYVAQHLVLHKDLAEDERRQLFLTYFDDLQLPPSRLHQLWPVLATTLDRLKALDPTLTSGELAWLAGLHPTLKKRARQHPRFVGR